MALMPYTNMSQDFMQPGAYGEMFIMMEYQDIDVMGKE